jgi:hypothetical protein
VAYADTFRVADTLCYDCDLAQLHERLAVRFVQLAPDEQLVLRALERQALRVARLARVPYLSVGDSRHPLYSLDSALLVCEPA